MALTHRLAVWEVGQRHRGTTAVKDLAQILIRTGRAVVAVAPGRPVRMRPRAAMALQTPDEPGLVAQAGHPPSPEPRSFTLVVVAVEHSQLRLRQVPEGPAVVAPVVKAQRAQTARPGQVVVVVRVAIQILFGHSRAETVDLALSSFAM